MEYRPRTYSFLDQWEFPGWRMKVCGIAHERERPSQRLVRAARRIAEEELRHTPAWINHYGVGFIVVHQGRTGNFVLVDYWADENELHNHVYASTGEDYESFEYLTPLGVAACAWDLKAIWHEREAWRQCVLEPATPDFDAYLRKRLIGRF